MGEFDWPAPDSISTLFRSRRDLLPFLDLLRYVVCPFMDRARCLADWRVWAALRLESASGTFVLERPVEHRCSVDHELPGRGEFSGAGAIVEVGPVIVREVVARVF